MVAYYHGGADGVEVVGAGDDVEAGEGGEVHEVVEGAGGGVLRYSRVGGEAEDERGEDAVEGAEGKGAVGGEGAGGEGEGGGCAGLEGEEDGGVEEDGEEEVGEGDVEEGGG